MAILEVNNVSIRYITGDFKDIGLKEYVMRKLRGDYHIQEFWADKNITFSLEKGDMLGIIGTNGAGKSTLLKAISGIMEPTAGTVKREGSIAALLELASGFDGDLTVRENAYLRGAMLGYTRKFMDETCGNIIEFAELEDFQDRPFKQLSSGMKSRLAFAIASLVRPDILILDEVLSVGDGAFRKKSEAKMREIIQGGATTILVSHSLSQIREMCNKVLWLHKGRQVAFGDDVQGICDQYQTFLDGGENMAGLEENCENMSEGGAERPAKAEASAEKNPQPGGKLIKKRGGGLAKERWSALLPAVFLSFTFCIFGPLEIYMTNISEFWFSIGDVVWPSILAGVICFVFLFLIGICLPAAFGKWYSCFLIGLGIALYIQGNYIQTSYGVLDGNEVQWDAYGSVAIWNSIVWIICLAVPFVAQKNMKTKFKNASSIVLCCILLVQAITLAVLTFTTDFSNSQSGKTAYLSDENVYSVSAEKNVVVFVLDAFDQEYLEEILSRKPDILNPWEGFTYYTNATCAYPTTKGSLPFMLTGQYYKNEQPYNDYLKSAFHNTDFYESLCEAGYEINLYTDDRFVPDDIKHTLLGNGKTGETAVSSHFGLEKSILQFTACRYFPHVLKRFVWFYSGAFDEYKDVADGALPYSINNISFYSGLITQKLQTLSGTNIYSLIHLEGVHPPYTLNADITLAEDETATSITQGIACLNIISEYISQLKKLGVYDNTMIIITADHGNTAGMGQWPIFLAKNFDRRGALNSSTAPISHENLIPTIMEMCGLNDGGKYGVPVDEISESDTEERKYYYYAWDNSWNIDYLPDISEYMVDSQKKITQTGTVFTSQGIETILAYEYQIGEYIVFTDDNDGRRYFKKGISSIETDFTWSLNKEGTMVLNLGSVSGDLLGEFQFKGIYAPPQKLVVRCGDLVLFDAEICSEEIPIHFLIPKDCIVDGKLVLDLEYPNAVSPYDHEGATDTRELAFRFYKIRFFAAEDQKEELSYQLGTDIVFTEADDGRRYFSSGISHVETDFAWSLGHSGQMLLYVGENTGDLTGEFLFKRLYTLPQRFTVRCGDLVLFDEEISSVEELIRFTIPESGIKDGWLTLDLEYPNAVSPKSLGKSEDSRVLAFGFKSIQFYATKE